MKNIGIIYWGTLEKCEVKANLKRVAPIKSSILVLLGSIVFVSAVISLMGYLKIRQRRKDSEPLKLQNCETVISDDRILFEFDVSKYEDESPEANEFYLKKVA